MEVGSSQSQPQSTKQKADALQSLSGPFSSSIAKLSGSSRGIPSDKDFHFYCNFNEFNAPITEISDTSQLMLDTIGYSSHLWGKEMAFPDEFDDVYDWLVNVNDELFERFDVSADEFEKLRKQEEERGSKLMSSVDSESGFQLVYGKKKGLNQLMEKDSSSSSSSSAVKVAYRDRKTMGTKQKIPFHIPTIPRPQDMFKIVVNNSNQPFDHVWLQRSEDGSRVIHPQEKFSALDFVDRNVVEPVKPPPTESTSFKLVEEVKDLKALAAKLRGVNEFAVDLEHNHYRSFQGLTCLMQVSTRTEDFVVDTLKLRIHIGPHLREVFKDPMKKKVMHGADHDIMWLQRDFGIYVCNMFDTGQASRVLKLERNSLEYLLSHFCGVTANKEYQNADWRLRPLPDEMLRYAREDTHYLLHIYDLMRIRLLSASTESENSDEPLVEVYKRSYDLCMRLYEKELLTDSSYLYIYGLQGAGFNAQQLAIVAGLCEWRDVVARAEDESTGYVLPNKTLLDIAKQKPVTTNMLRHLVKSKHPYVDRNLGSIVSIIRHSMQNAAAFEAAAELLKEVRVEMASEENTVSADGNETQLPESPARLTTTATESVGGGISINDSMTRNPPGSVHVKESLELGSRTAGICRNGQENSSHSGAQATVQVLKKPSRAFGAMLGNSAAKRKFDPDKKEEEELKIGQIKSSVSLPFHSFVATAEQSQPVVKEPAKVLESMLHEEPSSIKARSSNSDDVILIGNDASMNHDEPSALPPASSNLDDFILIEDDENVEEAITGETKNEQLEDGEDKTLWSDPEMGEEDDETMSLCDLSSSFQECFKSTNQTSKPKQADKSKESGGFLQLKPFDYEAARKEFRFGEDRKAKKGEEGNEGHRNNSRLDKVDRKKSSVAGHSRNDERTGDFVQGRRRQAFPATGNRSATFRSSRS